MTAQLRKPQESSSSRLSRQADSCCRETAAAGRQLPAGRQSPAGRQQPSQSQTQRQVDFETRREAGASAALEEEPGSADVPLTLEHQLSSFVNYHKLTSSAAETRRGRSAELRLWTPASSAPARLPADQPLSP